MSIGVESEEAEWLILMQNPVPVIQLNWTFQKLVARQIFLFMLMGFFFFMLNMALFFFLLAMILLEVADFYLLLKEGFLHEIYVDLGGLLGFVDDFIDVSGDEPIHLLEILGNDGGENRCIGEEGIF